MAGKENKIEDVGDSDFVKEMLESGQHGQTTLDADDETMMPTSSAYDLSSGPDNDSDSVCCETSPLKQWGGGIEGIGSPSSPSKYDHVSSLKMTYYAFKDNNNTQKPSVPLSLVCCLSQRTLID